MCKFSYSKIWLAFAVIAATLAACNKDDLSAGEQTGATTDETYVANTKDTAVTGAVKIVYNGTTATVTNPYEGNGIAVAVSGADVVITATTTTTEVPYLVSGTTTDGSLKIYSDYKFGLLLNGTNITNADGPAINIQSGKKVTVTLVGGTGNRLLDGATYATSTEDQKATFFSEGQLLFGGSGSLAVTGKYKHGICSDDYVAVSGGSITISSAASDGVHANDYFKMDGGALNVTASSDGVEAEEGYVQISGGTMNVNSVDDGIAASYDESDASVTPYIEITGGAVTVNTSGEKGNAIKSESYTTVNSNGTITLAVSGKGAKGFKTGGDFTLAKGSVNITTTGSAFYDTEDADIAAPAGINCDGKLSIADGTLTISSSGAGGKGITGDGELAISGGTVNITASGSIFTYGSDESEAKGIKSDGALTISGGNITIAAADDGIKSEKSIVIDNGTINITRSTEGIEAPMITVNNGNVSVVASDDCMNTTYGNGSEANDGSLMTFNGGTVALNTTGGDGIDGNGNIVMTGGTVVVQGPPAQPEVAIDYNGSFKISGGLLIASGPNGGNMTQNVSSTSTQRTVMIKMNGNVAAGTLINIQDGSGNSLVTYAPAKNTYYVIFSSDALKTGTTYKVYTGGSHTGTAVNGLYSGGTYSGGSQKGSFTLSNTISSVSL